MFPSIRQVVHNRRYFLLAKQKKVPSRRATPGSADKRRRQPFAKKHPTPKPDQSNQLFVRRNNSNFSSQIHRITNALQIDHRA